MNREKLEQLESLKKEIKIAHDEIDRLERAIQSGRVVMDSVKASRRCIPFDVHTVTIEGMSQERLEKKKERYRRKIREFQKLVDEIEEWIDTIEDSQMRLILQLRYRNGLSWQQVAASIGGRNTEDSVRMAHNRFFEKI